MSEKHANTPDVSAHRQLSPEEEKALEAGKSRWLPRIFQSYGTPIPELMSSPLKTGLIFGLPAGVIGAGLGSAIGGAATGKNHSGTGALLGGLGAGGLAALAAGMDREAKNEGLEELMRRMPEGAAKRDLEADPQYQADFLGWDNNKIVATARARYYRPTERFSKRTEDMAGARARYNERNKTSSMNKDVSMSQSDKKALFENLPLPVAGAMGGGLSGSLIGAPIGGLYGAVSAKPGKKLRGFLRGLAGGTGVGAMTGAGFGGALGAALPYDPRSLFSAAKHVHDPNRRAKEMQAMIAAGLGGVGGLGLGSAAVSDIAKRTEEPEDNDTEENKKAAHALLNNTTLTLAEKMAAYKALLSKQADAPIDLGPGASAIEAALPELRPAPSAYRARSTAGQRVLAGLPGGIPEADAGEPIPTVKLPYDIQGFGGGSKPTGKPAVASAKSESKWRPPSMVPDMSQASGTGAVRNTSTKKQDEFWNLYGQYFKQNLRGAKDMGGNFLGYLGKQHSNAMDKGKAFMQWLKPEAKPAADPSLLDKLKPYAPYAAVGGAGLGALALADYLSRRKSTKKKRRSEPQDEEYDMPKAASVNWYQIAREAHRQKRAMVPTAVLNAALKAHPPALLTRLGRMATSAAPYVNPTSGKALPFYAGMTLGDLSGSTGGFGVRGAISSLFKGKDPSMLNSLKAYAPYAAAGLGTAGVLGGAAYMGSRAGKNEAKQKKKKDEPKSEKQSNLGGAGLGAAGGAALGGLGGGLYGALAPGYERDPETGRRKRRSRLMAALRGLAGGVAAGGAVGGAAGYLAGDNNIKSVLEKFLASKGQAGGAPDSESGIKTDKTQQADLIETAKAEASMPRQSPAPIPQGPTAANATMGGVPGSMPGLQNTMPGPAPDMAAVQNVMQPPNPVPQAPVVPQGPTSANTTAGAPGMYPQGAM